MESQKTYKVGYSSINLCTMKVLTTIPITSWKCMGGLSMDFALYHLSSREERPEESDGRGKDKWMTSYDMRLKVKRSGGEISRIQIYYPSGAIEEWALYEPTHELYNVTGMKDTVEPLDGDAGFVVTLHNKMKVYYEQLMDTDLWAPTSIEQLSTSQDSHRITLDYNSNKQLELISDPDGKRKLKVYWRKVGADGHDAFYGVYTTQYFHQPGEPTLRPQLWWANYDPTGHLQFLYSPYAMANTVEDVQHACSRGNSDAPLFPSNLITLPSYSDSEFYNSMPMRFFGYDDADRITTVYDLGSDCANQSLPGSTSYSLTYRGYGPNTDRYVPFYGMYHGDILANDRDGTTCIHSTGPAYPFSEFDWAFGAYYGSQRCLVQTTVTDPDNHSRWYSHCAWQNDPRNNSGLKHDGPANLNRDRWNGFRIFTTATRDQNNRLMVEEFYWTAHGRNYSSSPSLRNVCVPEGKLGRYRIGLSTTPWGITAQSYVDTQYSYDSHGNLCEVLDANGGALTQMTYTSDDLLDTVTEPSGKKTKYQYMLDTRFLTKTEVDPDNLDITTSYTYDDYGNVKNVLGPYDTESLSNPPTVSYDYDTNWGGTYSLPVKVTDPDDRRISIGYTSLGYKQYESAPRRNDTEPLATTWWDYRKDGLPYYQYNTGATDSTTGYGAGGKVIWRTDANGNTVSYRYTSSGQIKTENRQLDAEHEVTTHYTYDNKGNLASVVMYPDAPRTSVTGQDVKIVASYTYDCLNRVTRTVYPGNPDYPGGTVVTTKYDERGNAVEIKASARSASGSEADDVAMPGNKVVDTYDYDKGDTYGKLIRRQYVKADGTIERQCDYDYYPYSTGSVSRGMLKGVIDSAYSSTSYAREYVYDTADRLVDEKRYDLGKAVQYQYTVSGKTRRLDISDINGANTYTSQFEYSPGGKLLSVTDALGLRTTFEYDDSRGRLTKKTFPNGAWTAYTYKTSGPSYGPEKRDLVGTVQNHSGSFDSTRTYYYDSIGNILAVSNPPEELSFGYDLAYRLTHEQCTNSATPYSYDYEYDFRGNRTLKNVLVGSPLGVTSYSHSDDNSLTSQSGAGGSVAYHYDASGNLISKTDSSGMTTYGYDVANNLTAFTPSVGASSAFVYDVDGTRVGTSDSRGTLTQIYVGGGLYMEFSTGGTLNLYAPGIGQLVNNVPSVYLADSQGNTVALSGNGGGVSAQYNYDAWGNRLSGPASWQTPFAYVGKDGYVSDPDTGLMKLGVRYYDPSIGRFITKDPARDGWNWYAYCWNNPVNLVDFTGYAGKKNSPESWVERLQQYSPRSIGVIGSARASAGGFALGACASASVGVGLFSDGWYVPHVDGFTGFDAFAGETYNNADFSHRDSNAVLGLYAGAGGGIWLSNAVCVDDMKKMDTNVFLDLGFFGNLSFDLYCGEGYWMFDCEPYGVGMGFDFGIQGSTTWSLRESFRYLQESGGDILSPDDPYQYHWLMGAF